LWEPAGWLAGLVAYYPLAGCSWVATTLSGVPGASVDLPGIHAGWAFAGYVVLGALGWFAFRHPAPIEERPPVAPAVLTGRRAVLGAVAGIVVVAAAWHSLRPIGGPGVLELAMLDVGQGDALLVTTPGGERVLIDGGPSGIETVRELSGVMPHWERDLDAVVLTHPQQDHAGGLPEVLERYDVGVVYDTGARNTTEAFADYERLADERQLVAAGDSFTIGGVQFEVLWPVAGYEAAELNDGSVVLRLRYGETSFLLTGDIEAEAQLALVAATDVTATVLKVPHHGSATSDTAFFAEAAPAVALIPVGVDNRFGHPAQESLDALDGAVIYRSDLHGRVVVRSDGERVEVRTERD
jgi:competence protein ComEC